MKWTDTEHETTYRLKRARCTPAGDTMSNPAATASDLIAALRANPEAMAEVVLRLADEALPHMNESLDWAKEKMRASESRALAAEKALADTQAKLSATQALVLDPPPERAMLEAVRLDRDTALSRLAEVERERDEADAEVDRVCERIGGASNPDFAIAKYARVCRRAEEAIRDRDAALAKLAEAEKFLGRCESQRLVPSSQCSVEEIALARDGGRMHVTSDGLGYVARTTARDPKIRPVWGAPPLPPHPPPITQAEEMRRRERISPTPRIEEDDAEVPPEVHECGWQWRPTGETSAFAPPFGTIRQCECGCLVAGGPSRCVRCVNAEEVVSEQLADAIRRKIPQ